ncbi:hypothetical protein Q5P01_026070 [Channa striata]|uniref:VWFA domain-containing protein n=1 Tax=Channa striata TaxID=64152 RepID=A0AA88IJH9_CHASR|nr:hypothetical protein Q5P01_026070 [Channa striata]
MAFAISACLAFTLDTTTSHISTMEDFFRNKVLQTLSGKNKGVVVSATQQQERSEEKHLSELDQTHREHLFENPAAGASTDATKVLVIITDGDPSDTNRNNIVQRYDAKNIIRFVIGVSCPNVVHAHHENSYLNSVCYKRTDHLQQDSSLTPACQDWTRKTVDLVFLLDGSASMTQTEFKKNKDFIENIMNRLKNSSIKFAVVQFSSDSRKVFDFNDYQAGTALDKLMNEAQMKSLTRTHRALTFVLDQLFENPAAGASTDATKVLVIITDGDPSDTNRNNIVQRYDAKNIIRFVIGVRVNTMDRFRAIASKPAEKYVFKIENCDGITGILEYFQRKNFKKEGEGFKVAQSGVFFKVSCPNVVHAHHENSYLNSVCYKRTDHLQQDSSLTPACQDWTRKTVDLVFLFDGSASMTQTEFNKNKDFIVDIIDSLKNSSIKFAAVQFSSDSRKVFDFNDYQAGTALDKLMNEAHMKSLTNTHRALRFVLEHLFENPAAGASTDATKVLVIITDGDPSDTDRNNIVQRYDAKNIIRFVMGIKCSQNVKVKVPSMHKFKSISSQPTGKYSFKIENYDGLTEIVEYFQRKNFITEGEVAWTGDQSDGIAQSGLNAVFYNDSLMLGSLRSNSWRSCLQEREGAQSEDPHVRMDAYTGHSVCVGKKNNHILYFTGAPRFEQKGQVVVFRHNCMNWTPGQRLNGDQIGSYFGAELCSVDIDSDGNTDFLLVGAPLFHQPQENTEGQIYVYRLTDEMQLENDNRGAVYIYLGDRHKGIRSTFSQRVTGRQIQPGLRFFGQAIDGDIGEDGLPHIVIGSQGTAVVLRSRPVFDVLADLTFKPKELSTEDTDCTVNIDEIIHKGILTACFEMVETTKSKAGTISSRLNVSYTLDVDPMRQTHRCFFSPTDRKAKSLTSTFELRDKDACFNYTIYMPKCVEDTSSPISIRLNFYQLDSESAHAVLNVDREKQAVVKILFGN